MPNAERFALKILNALEKGKGSRSVGTTLRRQVDEIVYGTGKRISKRTRGERLRAIEELGPTKASKAERAKRLKNLESTGIFDEPAVERVYAMGSSTTGKELPSDLDIILRTSGEFENRWLEAYLHNDAFTPKLENVDVATWLRSGSLGPMDQLDVMDLAKEGVRRYGSGYKWIRLLSAAPIATALSQDRKPTPEEKIGTQYRAYPIAGYEGVPEKWVNREHPEYEESIFQAPLTSLDIFGIGEIKGRPDYVAKGLRKSIMQREAWHAAQARVKNEVDELGEFLRNLLSGTWWHKRRTTPDMGKLQTMKATRAKGTLLGEPLGTSITKKPGLYGFGEKLLRMKPQFGDDPLKTVLFHQWEPHAEVMNEVYEETLRSFVREKPEKFKEFAGYSDISWKVGTDKFNARLTENLEARGYRAVLYSPVERYSEYELKMFPGHSAEGEGSEWLYYLDERKTHYPEVERYERMWGKKLRKEWAKQAKKGKYHHLKEHYRELPLKAIVKDELEKVGHGPQVPQKLGKDWHDKLPKSVQPSEFEQPFSLEMDVETAMNDIKDYVQTGKSTKGIVSTLMKLSEDSGLTQKEIATHSMKGSYDEVINAIYYKQGGTQPVEASVKYEFLKKKKAKEAVQSFYDTSSSTFIEDVMVYVEPYAKAKGVTKWKAMQQLKNELGIKGMGETGEKAKTLSVSSAEMKMMVNDISNYVSQGLHKKGKGVPPWTAMISSKTGLSVEEIIAYALDDDWSTLMGYYAPEMGIFHKAASLKAPSAEHNIGGIYFSKDVVSDMKSYLSSKGKGLLGNETQAVINQIANTKQIGYNGAYSILKAYVEGKLKQ